MKSEKARKLNRVFLSVESKVQLIEQKLLKKYSLNVSHRELIYLVFINDNKGKRMQEICESMSLSKGAFSNTVKTLVTKSLVKKERSLIDSRIMTLTLTKKGLEIYQVHNEARNQINNVFEEILTEEEMGNLFDICEKFIKYNLEK